MMYHDEEGPSVTHVDTARTTTGTTPGSAMELLTAPGGPFPLTRRVVDGVALEVFDRDPRTLRDAFLATATHAGDAVVYGEERWTFAEQWTEVLRLAHALREQVGVRQGDRVAIAMRNYPEWIFTFWATQLLGAVTVPLNAWLKPAELAALVADARPSVLVADRERVAAAVEADVAALGVRTVVGVRTDDLPQGALAYADLLAAAPADAGVPDVSVDPLDPATVLFTSGTTGRPKGAVGTHLNHAASLLNKLIRAVRVEPDGRVVMPRPGVKLVTFPFFHIAGVNTLYTSSYPGHRMVLLHKWEAAEAARLVEAEGVTELSGPPFVVQTFLDEVADGGRDVGSLTSIGLGGASIPPHVILRVHEQFGGRVKPRTGYGLTESTSGVVAIGGPDWIARPDSVGRALPTAEVAILDSEARVQPAGVEGEIALRGPQVITAYQHGASADSFVGGWFRTGDLGRLDDEGYLYVSGRLKDVVIRGGENIHCAEVEACLTEHADVVEAAAFGRPHPTLGEELAAIVRLRPGASADADAIRAHVAARLAAFKVPARVVLTEIGLPRTASGKILKLGIADEMGLAEALESAG
ncbi:class I adenylate-forming enzyme family protein [Nocardioides zeae]|uniref:Class I adenylate-forming enzyme family protein n=1 Tax=Nocardioides imazamoxiresistens TaxID=3231893 RepID=A0ABU3PTF1_9ACTN|nr:class I adenylate-forming enzyme family protein [Nocardioides zeae]MDT9592161.1 class I adenylate-forming enzyme family protein [Nocardioides zeae]